jgi:hypothetical protein
VNISHITIVACIIACYHVPVNGEIEELIDMGALKKLKMLMFAQLISHAAVIE